MNTPNFEKKYENEKDCRLTLLGKELLEKGVKKSNYCGRVHLPREWIGKKVKVVRVD